MSLIGERGLVRLDQVVAEVPTRGVFPMLTDEERNDGELVQRAPARVCAGCIAGAEQRQNLWPDKTGARVQSEECIETWVVLLCGLVAVSA